MPEVTVCLCTCEIVSKTIQLSYFIYLIHQTAAGTKYITMESKTKTTKYKKLFRNYQGMLECKYALIL